MTVAPEETAKTDFLSPVASTTAGAWPGHCSMVTVVETLTASSTVPATSMVAPEPASERAWEMVLQGPMAEQGLLSLPVEPDTKNVVDRRIRRSGRDEADPETPDEAEHADGQDEHEAETSASRRNGVGRWASLQTRKLPRHAATSRSCHRLSDRRILSSYRSVQFESNECDIMSFAGAGLLPFIDLVAQLCLVVVAFL